MGLTNRFSIVAIVAAVALVGFGAGIARADLITYDSQSDFLTDTGATSATGALPNLGLVGTGPITVGSVTIQSASGNLYVGGSTDWTTRLSGHDIAISGTEDLDIAVALMDPTYAFGFDFVEPEFDPNVNAPFVESTFEVKLLSGGTVVGSFTFSRPNDQATFVGVWTDFGFDSAEIRETIGANENEFFGQFYAGTTPIPEPGTLALLGLGLAGLVAAKRRRGRRSA